MTWNEYPEVKLAQRVLKKYPSSLPVKMDFLLKSYSTVIFGSIPIRGVDGIAINIKVPGKKPIVFINTDTTETRQRFTMAHELGHLIIPWHTGILIDDGEDYLASSASDIKLEIEANRFAAELLMPSTYIKKVAAHSIDLSWTQREICEKLKVSPLAAATQIINTFPPGVICITVENQIVTSSRKTKGTLEQLLSKKQIFNSNVYLSAVKNSFCTFNAITYYWWEMAPRLSAYELQDGLTWRQLLDEVVSFLESQQEREKYKKSVNAIIAKINGEKRKEADYTLEALLDLCYNRFNKDEHSQLRNHPFFDNFLRLRLQELLEKAKDKLN